jgi:hypothetical protein
VAGRWVEVGEASRELGISSDAVRKRIARGSLESDRRDGTVLVWLDDGGTKAGREAQVEGAQVLIESLQDQVTYLRSVLNEEREARRRADTIIAQLTQANAALATKVPELEAPRTQEPPGAAVTVEEELARGRPGPVPEAIRRPQRGRSRWGSRSAGPGGGGCSRGESRKRSSKPVARRRCYPRASRSGGPTL